MAWKKYIARVFCKGSTQAPLEAEKSKNIHNIALGPECSSSELSIIKFNYQKLNL